MSEQPKLHENLCPNCQALRKIARDYSGFNSILKEQCANQARELDDLRRRFTVLKKVFEDKAR
jgi:hypothetical protein